MPRIAQFLFDLASEHDGVFTAAEASDAGIAHETLGMAARRGTIRRLSRGIYRLVAYPSDEERVQRWEAVLWPTTRRGPVSKSGVLSHLTALHLNFASLEYTSPRVNITIPKAMRIRRTPPRWLEIHHADLEEHHITSIMGLPTTTLERTLRDCITARIDRQLILRVLDAINDPPLSRLMPQTEIDELRARLA